MERRQFIRTAAGTATVTALGGWYLYSEAATAHARTLTRPDGKPRLPPGQKVLQALKPMGGTPGSANPRDFRLRVHGEVRKPFEIDFRELLAMKQHDRKVDVHCVTGWSVLDAPWRGVRIGDLLDRAGPKDSARFLIVEAAAGYTANVPIAYAWHPDAMVVHRLHGKPLTRPHGPPARALIPDLYFWKSAKWITGLRLVTRDIPGYWETRGYHNRGDPWLEERHG